MNYVYHLLFMYAIMVLLAVSLDLFVGHLGILSLCHAAFWGFGAYTSGILTVMVGVGFPLAFLASMVSTMAFSQVLAVAAIRLRGDAVVLASLAIVMAIAEVWKNWRGLTGGLDGLVGIPQGAWGGFIIGIPSLQALQAAVFVVLSTMLVARLFRTPLMRNFHAFRDDAMGATGFGLCAFPTVARAAAISGMIAGGAGSLYACYASYINPTVFSASPSIMVLVMVLLGGAGSKAGPWLGALVLTGIPEIVRLSGISSSDVGSLYQVVLGLCLILVAAFRPRGMVKGYVFR